MKDSQRKAIHAKKKLAKGMMVFKGRYIFTKDHAKEIRLEKKLDIIKEELAVNLKEMKEDPTNLKITKERDHLHKQRKMIRGY